MMGTAGSAAGIWIVIVIVIVIVVVAGVAALTAAGRLGLPGGRRHSEKAQAIEPDPGSPGEILRRRYAAGEIDEDEYLRRLSGLSQR